MNSDTPNDVANSLTRLFLKELSDNKYTIRLDNDSKFRLVGVQEGELFIALRCTAFDNRDKNDQVPESTDQPSPTGPTGGVNKEG